MIYTFYSFKGGVGRSMALANVADRLARRGLRVLAIDFDLEAPGLERFYPVDKAAALANPGLIDLLRAFKDGLAGRGESLEVASFRDLSRFVFPIYEQVGEGGRLDLLPAGCRSSGEGLRRYALEVRTFDWQDFYYNWEGEAFFEWLRHELIGAHGRYDVVLVDSRTGVTEMGGVCAYQLADTVVMMSAANHQNLLGTQDVARDFQSAPVMALRHGRPLQLLVVPSRIEQRDPVLLDAFFERFQDTFEGQMPPELAGLSARQLAIPYQPEYAFEEIVVTDPARRDRLVGIGAAYERLADALVMLGSGAMQRLQPAARLSLWPSGNVPAMPDATVTHTQPASPALEPTLHYDPTRRFAGYDIYLSRGRESPLADRLALELRTRGFHVFADNLALLAGDDGSAATTHALHHSRTLVMCADEGGLSRWQRRELEQARSAAQPMRVLLVLLPGAEPDIFALSLKGVADKQAMDLRGWPTRTEEFELLVQQLGQREDAEVAEPTAPAFNPYAALAPGGEHHAGLLDLPVAALQDLIDGLREQHLMLLFGPSGAGKTTLVASGLVPSVRRGALGEPVPEVHWIDARKSPDWMTSLTPPGPESPPELCIIDHVDEHLAGLTERAAANAAQVQWLASFHPLMTLASARWRVLLVARRMLPTFGERCVSLESRESPRLDVPALRTGMAFEPGLIERLSGDVAAGREPLTLGQLVLPGLWDSARRGFITNEAYAASGGVSAAFARHQTEVLSRVPDDLNPAVGGILLWLLQSTGESDWGWRGSNWVNISQLRGFSVVTVNAVLWLVRERVLHLEEQDGALKFTPLLSLPPLACAPVQSLLEAHGPRVRLRDALAFALERWQRAKQDDDALLSGQALSDAESLVADWAANLTQDMVAFVGLSRQHADRLEQMRADAERARIDAEHAKQSVEARLRRARWAWGLGIMVSAVVVGIWWIQRPVRLPQPGTFIDEAAQAGRTAASFPHSTNPYFHDMDGAVALDDDEIAGRNMWLVWTGGNDRFWNAMTQYTFGAFDMLKVISSHPSLGYSRDNRWSYFGLVNEPCYGKPIAPDKNRRGVWLDVRSKDCGPDPFEDEAKYPGVAIGSRGKNLGDGTKQLVGSYYGYGTGILGLRLFPNPDFDEKAAKAWDPERYYTDPSYYNRADLIRPYRVGMSCGFCHVGLSPVNPPVDPEHPTFANLSSTVGAQYMRVDRLFILNSDKPDGRVNFTYQLAHTYRPGTMDTSLVSTDYINNPRTINAIYDFPSRMRLAVRFWHEKVSAGQLDNKQFNDFFGPGPLTSFYLGKDGTVPAPHLLKDGADSVGLLGALNRFYLNIGLFSEEWLLHFNPVVGGKPISPIEIAVVRKNSWYWQATEMGTPKTALFFLKAAQPDRLKDAPDGDAYLKIDAKTLAHGKDVFANTCARCHSSKGPLPPAQLDFSLGNCTGAGYLDCFKRYWSWTQSDEYKAQMRTIVQAPDFLQNNYLSTDARIPVTLLRTNICSALASNALGGDIWDNFSTQSYKELPSVGTVTLSDPFTGEPMAYKMPAGGRGYTRVPSLISVWSTAPFLLNNSLGPFDPSPSVAARMRVFDASIEQMLRPQKRARDPILGDKVPGVIDRTTQRSHITIAAGFVPDALQPLQGRLHRWLPRLIEAGGDVVLGPIPKGTPVGLLANLKLRTESGDPAAQLEQVRKLSDFLLKLKADLVTAPTDANNEELRSVFANLKQPMLALNTCPDLVVNRGHYFGTAEFNWTFGLSEDEKAFGHEPELSDVDKRALIAFLKTF